jgi:O-antigen ligase
MNALSLTAWCAALFASSALFSHDVALRLLLLALGLACAATAAVTHRRELRLVPSIWWAFLLWAGWAALSLTWSIEPARSNKEFLNEIVYVALAFLVCYIGAQAPRAARAIVPTLAAAATLLCSVALYAFLQGVQQYQDGWYGGPGDLSSALLMLMPAVLAAGWYGNRSGSPKALPLALALALFILVAAYTTLNRTVWAGLAIELLLLGGLVAIRKKDGTSRRVRSAAVVLAVSVVAGCALIAARVQVERQEADPNTAVGKDLRLRIWPEVLQRVEAAPLTGYGFGRGLFRHELTDEFGNGLIWHAHNLFLDTALQTGIPGLLLFLLLLGVVVREGWGALRRGVDDGTVACGLALLGVVTGMAVRNMTDTLLVRQNALFFWAMAGFLLGAIERRRTGG